MLKPDVSRSVGGRRRSVAQTHGTIVNIQHYVIIICITIYFSIY